MEKTEVSDNSKAITFIINSSSAVEKIELSTTHNITAKPSAKNKKLRNGSLVHKMIPLRGNEEWTAQHKYIRYYYYNCKLNSITNIYIFKTPKKNVYTCIIDKEKLLLLSD